MFSSFDHSPNNDQAYQIVISRKPAAIDERRHRVGARTDT